MTTETIPCAQRYSYLSAKNDWPVRLHKARLALAQGGSTGDRIADAAAALIRAAHKLEQELELPTHESFNLSAAQAADLRDERAALRKAREGFPDMAITVTGGVVNIDA